MYIVIGDEDRASCGEPETSKKCNSIIMTFAPTRNKRIMLYYRAGEVG